MAQPNVLFVMTDQQRYDTVSSLGNPYIHTPNLDRLVSRGVTFTNAYSTCPVCVAARYMIRTGCDVARTGVFSNHLPGDVRGRVEERCGAYLGRTMSKLGYRTFGVGKFHAAPWNEDLGYETQLYAEAQYSTAEQRAGDDYARFLQTTHPEYAHVETLTGERSEMYYMPQVSPFPSELTSEGWVGARAVEQVVADDERPFFGFVSFFSPHPPLAPPVPYNRAYDPERMPDPVVGDPDVDHADEQIPWMNYGVWAEDVDPVRARTLKARYYGEISHVDGWLGRILDAVESRSDADNTVICFYSDHGDHLGDHRAWQKESFFEASCRIPFLFSWPAQLPRGVHNDALVSLVDLFGLATGAAGQFEARDGVDLLGVARGDSRGRDTLIGYYGEPGTSLFKVMVRQGPWKYIFIANGGREQLFNLAEDPNELVDLSPTRADVNAKLSQAAYDAVRSDGLGGALGGSGLRTFPFQERPLTRILQFDRSRGVTGFPDHPSEILP